MVPDVGVGDLLRMTGSFLLVLSLLLVTLFFVKRLSISGGSSSRQLAVNAVHHLGFRQKLIVIKINGDEILVAQSPHAVTLLGSWKISELKGAEQSNIEVDSLSQFQNVPVKKHSFRKFLGQLLDRQRN
ncbi:MAG: hypothetical protein CBC09_08120 [Cellvibrionales bacterium TMED49]|nr:hypothetical protein [Porticoccaceae bacterium]OUU36870.1 MAG: hypothetical protein CBC09_08120 [Cellvibrionales bacterium TMED49]|tara:strand:- start:704 stop:1090 length:387 start_codon:yes stop_codon:yes gene_type:complete